MTDNKIDSSISRPQILSTDRSRPPAASAVSSHTAGTVAGSAASQDTVQITAASQRLADLENAVLSAPDVRTDHVARLQQAIANGSYQPSAERIADRLLTQEMSLLRSRG